MSWFSDRWGQGGPFGAATKAVDRNRGVIGDVVKYGSDIVAPFTGPFAPLVAGAGNALGTAITPGSNFGDIAKSGAFGTAAGYAGQALSSAFGAGSGAGAGAVDLPFDTAAADEALASSGANAASGGVAGGLDMTGKAAGAALDVNAPRSLGKQVLDKIGDVGSWAAKHPETISKGLGAISDAPMNEARAKSMGLQNQLYEDELRRRKSLDPLRQAFAGQLNQYMNAPRTPTSIARNPYAPPAAP